MANRLTPSSPKQQNIRWIVIATATATTSLALYFRYSASTSTSKVLRVGPENSSWWDVHILRSLDACGLIHFQSVLTSITIPSHTCLNTTLQAYATLSSRGCPGINMKTPLSWHLELWRRHGKHLTATVPLGISLGQILLVNKV